MEYTLNEDEIITLITTFQDMADRYGDEGLTPGEANLRKKLEHIYAEKVKILKK